MTPSKQRPMSLVADHFFFCGKREVNGWHGNQPDVRPGAGKRPGNV